MGKTSADFMSKPTNKFTQQYVSAYRIYLYSGVVAKV